MANRDNKTRYNMDYAKKNLKRIPLDVQKEKYEEIAAAAAKKEETVNGYIKKAIDQRMERDADPEQDEIAEAKADTSPTTSHNDIAW